MSVHVHVRFATIAITSHSFEYTERVHRWRLPAIDALILLDDIRTPNFCNRGTVRGTQNSQHSYSNVKLIGHNPVLFNLISRHISL